MKKLISLLSVLLALCALLWGCGRKNDPDAWCTLKNGQLVLTLPQPKESGFRWEYSLSENSPAQLVSQTAKKDTLVLVFAAAEDGEINLSLSYADADSAVLEEIRNVQAACTEGRISEILQQNIMDMHMFLGTEGAGKP